MYQHVRISQITLQLSRQKYYLRHIYVKYGNAYLKIRHKLKSVHIDVFG